jgi:hypothetical protein
MFYVLSYFDSDDGDTPAGVYDDPAKAKEAAEKDLPGLTWSVPVETNMFWGKLPDNPNYGYYITEFELNAPVGITVEPDDESDDGEKLGVDAPDFDNTQVPNFEPWKDLMNATVLKWDEVNVPKGTRILIQGALMKFIREITEKSDEDTKYIEVEYKGMEMEMTVFRKYLTAIITED